MSMHSYSQMFDIIDHDHDGIASKSDLRKLQEFDFLDAKLIEEVRAACDVMRCHALGCFARASPCLPSHVLLPS